MKYSKIEIAEQGEQGLVLSENIALELKMIKAQKDVLETREKQLKEEILKAMEKNHIIKLDDEVNGVKVAYVGETFRERFDSKKFKEEHPDEYDDYVSISQVKPSVRFTFAKKVSE